MKYWAYLNDDVSQKPFTEEELQQLPGFGPEMLICSEVSAVSRDPEWKPVKEILPHLIRPKAPDFSKFRPKPPVPPQQNSSIPQASPISDTLASFVQPTSAQQDSSVAGLDNNLLAQLRTLTSKLESLENKIEEQEKELVNANVNQNYEQGIDETFVSEPQNEQEDDVLEVPFDSDFEVPFDASKSSEEIAKEAEEMLAKPNSTEIEEYDTDDQNTELMNYTSDMQKILEDTIRESNFHPEQPEQPKKKRKTFIAEDLVSKEKLKFSVEEDKKDKKESEDNQQENKENIPQEQNNAENNQAAEVPTKETEQNNSENEIKSLTELLAGKEENSGTEEQNQGNTSQLASVNDAPEKRDEKSVQEEGTAELRLTSVEEAPKGNKEESVQEEETAEPQLASVEKAPESKMKETVHEEVQVEPQLVSIEDALTKETEKEEPQAFSETKGEEIKPEEHAEEPVQEEIHEELQATPETEGEEVKPEEPLDEGQKQEEVKEEDAEGLKTFALDEFSDGPADVISEQVEGEQVEKSAEEEQSQEELKVAPETEGEEVKPEETAEENQIEEESAGEELKVAPEPEEENKSNFDEIVSKVEVPAELENTNLDEKTSDFSKTQDVTISEDDTTAAVLSEIAEEKAHDVKNITTSDQLFAELENTYRNEDQEKKDDKITGAVKDSTTTLEVDLNQDIVKEDEFLKTFTTSVEEVFLDQPTAIISDYVPPTDNVEHTKPEELENSVKREKPSDIKTVPLVPEVLGQEIHSSPYVESATAKLRQTSPVVNTIKWTAIGIVIAIIVMAALSGLAVMGKIPEKLSPIHAIIYSLRKPQPQQVDNTFEDDMDLAPEMINQEVQGDQTALMSEQARIEAVIGQVRKYAFPDGTTLEDRIQNIHGNISDQIEWSLFPTEENGIYSIAVKIPQNQDGQGFSYRFNYDFDNNKLDPTTSEAKNIMENYSR